MGCIKVLINIDFHIPRKIYGSVCLAYITWTSNLSCISSPVQLICAKHRKSNVNHLLLHIIQKWISNLIYVIWLSPLTGLQADVPIGRAGYSRMVKRNNSSWFSLLFCSVWKKKLPIESIQKLFIPYKTWS